MALYDRLLSTAGRKIPVHSFQALMGEVARGRLTGAQAQAAIEALTGEPLDQAGVSEAQTLLGTVSGTAAQKLARAKEIDDVLLLAEAGAPGYGTVAEIKTRLGV